MKQKLLTLLLIAFIPIAMMAYDVEVDGIYYNLNTSDNTASVTETKGDVNGDGIIDVVDIVAIVNYCLGYSSGNFNFEAADLDGNGEINVTDAFKVGRMIMDQTAGAESPTPHVFADKLRVNDFTIQPGETKTISVELNNPDQTYTAFEFYMTLPDGISIVEGEDGNLEVKLNSARSNYILMAEQSSDGSYHFLCSSFNDFEGTEGEILSVSIKADEALDDGVLQGALINQKLCDRDENKVVLDDFTYNITVKEYPVTVTANSYIIEYGDPIPTLEYTSEGGILRGEPTLSCEATSVSPVGTYPITVSTGSVLNHQMTTVAGTLTVTKAPLTITAKNYSIYRGDPLPEYEAIYSGFKNNETASVLTNQPVFSCSATSSDNLGTYAITPSRAEARNYEISYEEGKLSITKAPLTIKAQSYLLKRGEPLPSLEDIEITYEGFKNGEDERVLTSLPTVSCEATDSNVPGSYPITISGAEADNYYIRYIEGKLYIMEDGIILPWGQDFAREMKYFYQDSSEGVAPTNDANGKAWYEVGYDDSVWETLTGPISGYDGWPIEEFHKKEDNCFYLRQTFNINLSDNLSEYVCLQFYNGCDVVFYINGKEVISRPFDGGDVHVGKIPIEAFVEGTNTLAIYINNFVGDAYFDYTLFDHAAITIPEEGVTTYCPTCDLDFSGVTDIKAYVAASYSNGTVFMKQVDSAPAGTGLYLQGTPGYYSVPFKSTTKYEHNLLVGTSYYGAIIGGTEGNKTNLVLERFFNEHWEDPPAEPMSHGKKRVSTQVKGNTNFYPITWHLNDMPANSAWLQLPTSICTVEEVSVGFLEDESSPDLNKDGRVTVTDVMMLVKKVLNN